VQNIKVGDRVLAPLSSLTWRERMVIAADGLFALPPNRTRSNWRCWPSILRRRSCCSANLSI
jgi:hypothetical protein